VELNRLVLLVESSQEHPPHSLRAAMKVVKPEVQQVRVHIEFASLSEVCLGGLAGVGYESGLAEGAGAGGAYGSSSYSAGIGGGSAEGSAGFGSASYGSSSYSSGGAGGFDVVAAAFNSADKNKDGTVDANEFKQFYQGGL
jgi:hypothetical protein